MKVRKWLFLIGLVLIPAAVFASGGLYSPLDLQVQSSGIVTPAIGASMVMPYRAMGIILLYLAVVVGIGSVAFSMLRDMLEGFPEAWKRFIGG